MKVLVACEFSGIVRDAFAKRGHDAWSCDLLPTEKQGKHIQDDVLDHISPVWDLMIAHPPCTYLANSGVCWLYNKDKTRFELRWEFMRYAARFFKSLLDAPIERICIENPIPHKYALEILGRKYDQIIHPWLFGHTEQKPTCLWLKNLPALKETNNVKEETKKLPRSQRQRIHWMQPSENRQKERSRTYQGIADAMAEQWG